MGVNGGPVGKLMGVNDDPGGVGEPMAVSGGPGGGPLGPNGGPVGRLMEVNEASGGGELMGVNGGPEGRLMEVGGCPEGGISGSGWGSVVGTAGVELLGVNGRPGRLWVVEVGERWLQGFGGCLAQGSGGFSGFSGGCCFSGLQGPQMMSAGSSLRV